MYMNFVMEALQSFANLPAMTVPKSCQRLSHIALIVSPCQPTIATPRLSLGSFLLAYHWKPRTKTDKGNGEKNKAFSSNLLEYEGGKTP